MTGKDREIVEKLLKEAAETQSKMIGLQLENILGLLGTIDKKLSWTNGQVGEHSKMIQQLKDSEIRHVMNCPQKKDLDSLRDKLINIEKMEVGRQAVSKFTVKQITGLGIVAGIVFSILNFIYEFLK